jgi:hypothetical protein
MISCEFCKSKVESSTSLKYHQSTNKYCLEKQYLEKQYRGELYTLDIKIDKLTKQLKEFIESFDIKDDSSPVYTTFIDKQNNDFYMTTCYRRKIKKGSVIFRL